MITLQSRKTLFGLAYVSIIIGIVSLALLQTSCNSCGESIPTSNGDASSQETEGPQQLNVSILLDLSDRIDSVKHPAFPNHIKRDLSIINHITCIFRNEMNRLGTFDANGKIQVLFYPAPPIVNIDILQSNLKVNLRGMDVKQKKAVYDNILSEFQSTLQNIYSETINNNKYTDGSDIWRFFKNDVADYCIDKDTNYRNILVIITDGYIYEKTSLQKSGNRVQNLTVGTIGKYRNSPDPIAAIEKDNFGLMVSRNDLQNLEVLILEVEPEGNSQKDEDILTHCLGKWMNEMNVSRHAVYKTDLPSNTEQRIDAFFNLK